MPGASAVAPILRVTCKHEPLDWQSAQCAIGAQQIVQFNGALEVERHIGPGALELDQWRLGNSHGAKQERKSGSVGAADIERVQRGGRLIELLIATR